MHILIGLACFCIIVASIPMLLGFVADLLTLLIILPMILAGLAVAGFFVWWLGEGLVGITHWSRWATYPLTLALIAAWAFYESVIKDRYEIVPGGWGKIRVKDKS
jgi:hypothetical protein